MVLNTKNEFCQLFLGNLQAPLIIVVLVVVFDMHALRVTSCVFFHSLVFASNPIPMNHIFYCLPVSSLPFHQQSYL
jgi:hypothetical protein